MSEYYKRLIEEKIERILKSSGAMLLTGPKFVGKTTTCTKFAKSSIALIDDDLIGIVSADPKVALLGETPHLIDEWQTVPEIWNYVRKRVDEEKKFGLYLLTGSSTPVDNNKLHHSGAGRITCLRMRTMTLEESKESKCLVSLSNLFSDSSFSIFDDNNDYSLSDTAFYICRGGWPLSLQKDRNVALDVTSNYYNGLFNFNASENIKYKNKKSNVLRMLLRSYARNISTQASYQTILKDVTSSNKQKIERKTFDSYIDVANELSIIEDMEAWTPNIRSKVAIRTTPTRHFVDTSLACQALNINEAKLLSDAKTFGLMFEDFVVKELRAYADLLDGEVKHYRDSNGLECDAVICLKDGRWGMIEIKLGSEKGIEEGSKNLNKLESLLDDKYQLPSFKIIITAVGRLYKRKDGILVVPINTLCK